MRRRPPPVLRDPRSEPGTTKRLEAEEAEALMQPVEGGRLIRVTFDSHVSDLLDWSFTPAQARPFGFLKKCSTLRQLSPGSPPPQRDMKVTPGETALAFFTTKNKADHPITGVATYNVQPPQAGQYFVKIQCFCFDEQRLQAGEEVDMPVFFVIDPKFNEDPALRRISNITLSYNFFKTGDDYDEDEDEDEEDDDEEDAKDLGSSNAPPAPIQARS